jgi:protein-disulfide isomerase
VRIPKLVLTGIILVVIVGAVTGVRSLSLRGAPSTKEPLSAARMIGAPQAKVRVVEFTDFQCPACAHASSIVHEALARHSREVSLELKYFPLPMHKNARSAAVAAQCAFEQGKFWPMHNVLFMSQKSWGDLRDPSDYFLSLGRGLGLDDVKMAACMTSSATQKKVMDDVAEGRSTGVKATPTFFVNGKMVVGAGSFGEALAEALK